MSPLPLSRVHEFVPPTPTQPHFSDSDLSGTGGPGLWIAIRALFLGALAGLSAIAATFLFIWSRPGHDVPTSSTVGDDLGYLASTLALSSITGFLVFLTITIVSWRLLSRNGAPQAPSGPPDTE